MAIAYQGAGELTHSGPDANYVLDPTSFATAGDVFAVNIISDPDVLNDVQVWSSVPSSAQQVIAPSASATSGHFVASTLWLVPWTSGTLTWTLGSTPYEYASGDGGAGGYLWFRGVDNTDPLGSNVGIRPYSSSAVTSHPVPSVDTEEDGCYIIGGLNIASGSQTLTVPGGWTLRVNSSIRDGWMLTKGAQATAGSSGGVTFAHNGSTRRGLGWQLGLRPAAAGPVIPTITRDLIIGALT